MELTRRNFSAHHGLVHHHSCCFDRATHRRFTLQLRKCAQQSRLLMQRAEPYSASRVTPVTMSDPKGEFMNATYEGMFRDVHAATGKLELDGRPSLLSAVLILSATQYLNLLSAVMVLDASGLWRMTLPRVGSMLALLALGGLNYMYSRHLGVVAGSDPSRKARWTSPGMLYVFASIFAFVGSALYMSSVYLP